MTVPYAFANLSGNIALAKLDSNFNTPITIGNTSVLLGNTVTTLNNLTLANVTITSGTSNVTNVNVTNVTVTNLTATLANVTTLNVASAYITSANIGTLALTNALPVSSGGTGQVTFPANSVLLGNGTGGIATVAPGNVGNVLTSIGGLWVSNVALSGAAAGANTQVQYNSSNALAASANLTFNGTTLTANTLNLTNALGTTYGGTGLTSFTANGVVYASSTSALTTGSALTFDGNNLGLGVTPSAGLAAATYRLFEIGQNAGGSLYAGNNQFLIGTNIAWDGGTSRYKETGLAPTMYNQQASAHQFFTAPSGTAGNAITFTQAMTLDSSGNFSLGTTSVFNSAANRGNISLNGATDSIFNFGIAGANSAYIYSASGTLELSALGSSIIKLTTNGSERARIDASGNLLVGQTSTGLVNSTSYSFELDGQGIRNNHGSGTPSGYAYMQFGLAGTSIGSITQSGTTAVLYNLTSDQRLKENIQDAAPASALIDSLQVRQYNWKSDGSHQRYGFVAQELVTVAPEAVHQPADPEEMMAVDYSKLVPMLVKEIQSLRIRIAQLEAQ